MYLMLLYYTATITASIYREASGQESPASRVGQGVVTLVEHRHHRDRLVSMSRVPIKGTLPSASDQVIPGRDLGVIDRASSRATRANSVFSRANGGVVTASRAVSNKDREEEISGVDVSVAVRMAIGARIAQRERGPHSSRVSVMSHRGHFFQPYSQHQPKYLPY